MSELKLSDSEKEELIIKLTRLHSQAIKFIAEMKTGKLEKSIAEKDLNEFKRLTLSLGEYIKEIKGGTNPYTTYEEWCEALANTILDDDNFYIEEDGFLWH